MVFPNGGCGKCYDCEVYPSCCGMVTCEGKRLPHPKAFYSLALSALLH